MLAIVISQSYTFGLAHAVNQLSILWNHTSSFDGPDDIMKITQARVQFLVTPWHMLAFALHPYYAAVGPNEDSAEFQTALVTKYLKCVVSTDEEKVLIAQEYQLFAGKSGPFTYSQELYDPQLTKDGSAWWKANGKRTKLLRDVAVKLLQLLASSAPAEGNWCAQASIISPRRARMLDWRATAAVSILWNMRQAYNLENQADPQTEAQEQKRTMFNVSQKDADLQMFKVSVLSDGFVDFVETCVNRYPDGYVNKFPEDSQTGAYST